MYGKFQSPSKNDLISVINAGNGKLIESLPPLPKTQEEEFARKKLFVICPNDMSNDDASDIYFRCGSHPLGK